MTVLAVDIQEKRYPAVGRAGANLALKDLRFEVARGELVCVVGPSGCGKTTLLNIIAGLDRAFAGHLTQPPSAGGRPQIGYVFQNARLLPWRTVLENIELVMPPGEGRRQRILDLLAVTGLGDVAHVYPERLSVGMARRVALARAFAIDPHLLLLDEPFVSLDEPTAQRLRALLVEIWRRQPTTVLFVTHDLREAILLADRILVLSPPPARVAASIPVTLPRETRHADAALEALRQRLLREFGESFGSL
ncbi:ABC transporter ATP-binding protein [Reyranella sp. CPCC 100927]|uniref:ABC transporter ATP-binding protein n=1 Tax=Reyranella sp. CPCC 100927 TaxID=2599616 RepID=UPI0011B3C34F|nr:ABC transporter ATP-binding protein [Reyranella sp. CPCC 100927]TWT10660.1 ABC transporter ATP-binding protein [Reyranella sp. CPCC 100927]